MFFVFLTIVSSVSVISYFTYKSAALKARQPVQHDDIIQLQQEVNRLKQRMQAVEAIVALEPESKNSIIDIPDPEPETNSSDAAGVRIAQKGAV